MDENRELRAMLFSVIHIPPLPSIVSRLDREDNTVIDESAVESSHSIIGSMLEWTAMANNQAANTNRMGMQNMLLAQFRSDLRKLDPTNCPVEDLYNFYCHHTRAWLNTYSTLGNMMRFKPIDYVLNNDKTHQNMRGYTKAQYHLFTDGKETLELEDSVTYADLLRKCAQWTKQAYEEEDNTTKSQASRLNQDNDVNKVNDNAEATLSHIQAADADSVTGSEFNDETCTESITTEPETSNLTNDKSYSSHIKEVSLLPDNTNTIEKCES